MTTMPSILTPKGKTHLYGPPLHWQSYAGLEMVAAATSDGGNVIHLVDCDQDGVLALRQFGAWEKIRERKTKGPHIHSINYRDITSSQQLVDKVLELLAPDNTPPVIIVRDVSRLVTPMSSTGQWLRWLPEVAYRVPSNILTISHTGILGRDTLPARLFTACWSLKDGHENVGGRPTERYGERINLVNDKTGQTIKLHGHNYPGGLAFDLYQEPHKKELVA
jgi:hypothetical protein